MTRRSPSYFEANSEPVERRVAVGLHKLGLAMKHQDWSSANEEGLSPTQGQILAAISVEGALSGSELAERLGVTLSTVSESVRALVDKGYAGRSPDPRHPRAKLVSLTRRGRDAVKRVGEWPDFLAGSVAALSDGEREAVLTAVIKMIRSLQERGLVAPHRMCVTCVHFRPRVHDGPMPHHCAFVDAPMADRHLRVECGDHAPADEAQRESTWQTFAGR